MKSALLAVDVPRGPTGRLLPVVAHAEVVARVVDERLLTDRLTGELLFSECDQALRDFPAHRAVLPRRGVGAERDPELGGDFPFHLLDSGLSLRSYKTVV